MSLTPASSFGNASAGYLSGAAYAGNGGKVGYLLGLPSSSVPPGFTASSPQGRYSKATTFPAAQLLSAVALRIGPRCVIIPFVNWTAP